MSDFSSVEAQDELRGYAAAARSTTFVSYARQAFDNQFGSPFRVIEALLDELVTLRDRALSAEAEVARLRQAIEAFFAATDELPLADYGDHAGMDWPNAALQSEAEDALAAALAVGAGTEPKENEK